MATHSPLRPDTSIQAVRFLPEQVPLLSHAGTAYPSPLAAAKRKPTATLELKPNLEASNAAAVANCSSSPIAATSWLSSVEPATACLSFSSVNIVSILRIE